MAFPHLMKTSVLPGLRLDCPQSPTQTSCICGQFSKYKPPEGLYLEGRFNGGFFGLPDWGAYIWRGLFSEFYGISLGKYQTYWRGVSLMKDPLDLTILQQLLWELKPRTVIEFGAYKGGSALWLADMLKMYGCQSRIISTDIDLSLLDAEAKKSKDVEFIQGDSSNIEQFFPDEFLKVR